MTPHAPDQAPQDPPLSRLLREQPPAEPPAALDAHILAAARAAVAPKHRPWWQRLQLPVAIAATGMLAVMLTLTMERNPPETMAPLPEAAPAAAPASPAAANTDALRSEAPRAKRAPEASPPSSPPSSATRDTFRQLEQEQPLAKPTPSPASAAELSSPSAEKTSAPAKNEATQATASPAPPAVSAAPAAQAMPRAAGRLRMEDRALAPEDWIARIRELLQQGKQAEAASQWQAFRNAHPDYPLPEDLRQSP